MRVRLLISENAWLPGGRHLPVAGSALLHAAVLTALMSYSPDRAPDTMDQLFRNSHLQILQLTPVLYLPPPQESAPVSLSQAKPRKLQQAVAHSHASQMLMVEGAPHVKLPAPIPLPAIFSSTASRPLPPRTEQVRVDDAETRRQVLAAIPDLPEIPQVRIISIPDRLLQIDNTTTIPAVNQLAGGTGWSDPGSSQTHQSGEPGRSTEAMPPNHGISDPVTSTTPETPTDKALTRIEMPPDGRAPMSVFGESVAAQHPETADQMRGLVVSTTYLPVGLKKNWILEYWTTAQDKKMTSSASAPQLDSPWPRVMFRPELALPSDAGPVMVRALLTAEGRLEDLKLLFPPEWVQKDILFHALAEWKFRPASRQGQPQPVEVLLVIPRQPEE